MLTIFRTRSTGGILAHTHVQTGAMLLFLVMLKNCLYSYCGSCMPSPPKESINKPMVLFAYRRPFTFLWGYKHMHLTTREVLQNPDREEHLSKKPLAIGMHDLAQWKNINVIVQFRTPQQSPNIYTSEFQ